MVLGIQTIEGQRQPDSDVLIFLNLKLSALKKEGIFFLLLLPGTRAFLQEFQCFRYYHDSYYLSPKVLFNTSRKKRGVMIDFVVC